MAGIALLASPAHSAVVSLATFKSTYAGVVGANSAIEMQKINEKIEGTSGPTDATQLTLWTWYRAVSQADIKAAAKKVMDDQVVTLGGVDANSLKMQYMTASTAAQTTADDLAKKITTYKCVVSNPMADCTVAEDEAAWKAYQHLSAADKESLVQSSLIAPVMKQWHTNFALATAWPAATYKDATNLVNDVLNNKAVYAADTAKGADLKTTYQASVKDVPVIKKHVDAFMVAKLSEKI